MYPLRKIRLPAAGERPEDERLRYLPDAIFETVPEIWLPICLPADAAPETTPETVLVIAPPVDSAFETASETTPETVPVIALPADSALETASETVPETAPVMPVPLLEPDSELLLRHPAKTKTKARTTAAKKIDFLFILIPPFRLLSCPFRMQNTDT